MKKKIEIDGKKYRIRRKRKCVVCNKRIKFDINDCIDTELDIAVESYIKFWNSKNCFWYCSDCNTKINKLLKCKYFCLETDQLICEYNKNNLINCKYNSPHECNKSMRITKEKYRLF